MHLVRRVRSGELTVPSSMEQRTMSDIPESGIPGARRRSARRLAGYGERRDVAPARSCSRRRSAGYDFIVILSGAVEILGSDGTGGQAVITRHGARRFLGEVSLLTRQRPYLTARVVEGGEIIVVPADVFRVAGDGRRPGRATPSSRRSSPAGRCCCRAPPTRC